MAKLAVEGLINRCDRVCPLKQGSEVLVSQASKQQAAALASSASP
jgi:hypothetical protein